MMNCEKVRLKISELSADNLSTRDAGRMLEHFASCSSCQQCWEEYQQLMFVLSSATQPIPGATQSQQMWTHCRQRITESEIDSRYTTAARAAIKKSLHESSGNSLFSWVTAQPRWSWVALGGAMAALAGAWFATTPAPAPTNTVPVNAAGIFARSNVNHVDFTPAPPSNQPPLNLPSYDASAPAVFAAPAMPASQFVDHHSIMEGTPLNDAASSSVVSYTVPNSTP
jgi:hypothetical protein